MHSDRIPYSTGGNISRNNGKTRAVLLLSVQKSLLLLGLQAPHGFNRMRKVLKNTAEGFGVDAAPRLIVPVQHVSLTIATRQLQPSSPKSETCGPHASRHFGSVRELAATAQSGS